MYDVPCVGEGFHESFPAALAVSHHLASAFFERRALVATVLGWTALSLSTQGTEQVATSFFGFVTMASHADWFLVHVL